MAKPITDDYNAVDPSRVFGVQKPEAPENWSLAIQLEGVSAPSQLRFISTDARDDFFKKLVDAMGQ